MRQLLTASQAQSLLQVSRQTLANWERDGKISTVRIGGVVRYWVDVSSNKGTANEKQNRS
jgi:predicted site-specific integrase-resolvase